ncbi:MAG: BCCT family transporter [Acidobacteriota bacterium]
METEDRRAPKPALDHLTFWPAILVVLALSIPLALYPESSSEMIGRLLAAVTSRFGWLFLLFGITSLVFLLWLALGRYGNIRLGARGDRPEFSNVSWVAMMFCAGIGIAIVNWAFVEPLYFLSRPPLGIEAHSSTAVEWAAMYGQFHWGFIPWAIYTLATVPVAYAIYVRRLPFLRISTSCKGILGDKADGWLGAAIDLTVILSIMGGVGTSLGLAVPLVSALISELFGVRDSLLLNLGILLFWTLLFGYSTYKGLNRGIKRLSDINIVLSLGLLIFVLLAGPTFFLLKLWTNSLGLFWDNLFRISTWTDPVNQGGFPEEWTVFYWAWWVAYTPMMGLFIARISRGRTIKEVILNEIGWGALGSMAFFAIWGGYALYIDTHAIAPLSEILSSRGIPSTVVAVLQTLPGGALTLAAFTVLAFIFLATTLDSSAYTLASVSTRNLTGYQEPARWNRLVWALAIGILASGLVMVGGLEAVRMSTILFALPMILGLVILCWSLLSWLRMDFGEALRSPAYVLDETAAGKAVVQVDHTHRKGTGVSS